MRRFAVVISALALASLALAAQPITNDRGVERFAALPTGEPGHPEGIAADPSGNIYAASFDFSGNNNIYVFGRNGKLTDTITLNGHVPLGLQFGSDGKLYVADFGTGSVLQIRVSDHQITNSWVVCAGAGTTCALNAIAFDPNFDTNHILYVSDSFGGNIFRVNTLTGPLTPYVSSDERLKPAPPPHGFPPFGANGLAFKGSDLYVANTADDRILKIDSAKNITTFVESINGADGITFDSAGRLWVCANQENVLYVVDGDGAVAEIRGSFDGIGQDGAPRGLLFPASIVPSGGDMYITNTALDFRHHFVGETPVTTFTISRTKISH